MSQAASAASNRSPVLKTLQAQQEVCHEPFPVAKQNPRALFFAFLGGIPD
jgi:hypothetical protein